MATNTIEFYEEHIPVASFFIKWFDDNDIDFGPLAAIISFSLFIIGLFVFGVSFGNVVSIFFALAPLWMPPILLHFFFERWMDTVGTKYYLSQGRRTLRLKIPQEIFKSPEAMEFVLAQIHNTANPDNLMQTYLDGKRPLPFSLEIVSLGGEIRFYVNLPTRKTSNAFEANIYAQYPGIEVAEEPVDYAAEVALESFAEEYDVFSTHMRKKKDQEFPVKSYIDYEMDKLPKEELKIDPITPTLDVLASIRPFERVYVQFICVSYRPESFKNGQLRFSEGSDWTKGVEEKVNEIMQRDQETKLSKHKYNQDDEDAVGGNPMLTAGEKNKVEAMERNSSKYAYKVGMRWVYITKKGHFNGDIINPLIRMYSQYDSIGRNAIGVAWRTDFDYKDFFPGKKKHELHHLKRQELKEYKLRKYFPKGGLDGYKIFTVEELATMFHLPGKVALTPTLERIPSTRAEAPPNLPIGEI